jgi:UPF0716 protein FxsA
MPFSLIPVLLLVIPLAEIAAFIVIGREIGVLWTLAMVFFTAVLGSVLLRVQGFGIINRIRSEMEAGRMPGRELVHGVMILVAGILLLTPGFITDTMGFLLFIPAVRDAGWHFLRSRISIVTASPQGSRGAPPDRDRQPTIDLDESEFERDPNRDSPWADK